MNIEKALSELHAMKLFAEFSTSRNQRIIGGTEVSHDLGINVYKNPFTICRDNDDWMVIISGPGQCDTKRTVTSLEEAINTLAKVYTSR